MSNTSFVVAPMAHGTVLGVSEGDGRFHSVAAPDGAIKMNYEISARNPAPNASPPASPGTSHRDVVICR